MSLISKIVNLFSPTAQKTGDEQDNKMAVTSKRMRDTACALAAEGIVLLKNDGVLPIKSEDNVAVFGRTQINWFCVGYGSGGDVKAPYKNTFAVWLKNQKDININADVMAAYDEWCAKHVPDEGFWGHWPFRFEEMPLDINFVKKAREKSNVAFVVIGRAAGEDREQKLAKGSYYLADDELKMLDKVCSVFEKVVLILDTGNVIDFSQIDEYGDRISAIVLAWQGGMESGRALCDVLSGKVNPSGRLTDTIAVNYDLYPSQQFGFKDYNVYQEDVFVGYRYFETFAKEEVLYPFGFGLSYTTFAVTGGVEKTESGARVTAKVKNTGERKGKTVVQIYVKKADGMLVKPARELVAYAKTIELESGAEEEFSFDISEYALSCYDEEGATGYKACWVLEYGDYEFFAGENVREATSVGSVRFDKKITSECHTVCSPQKDLSVLLRYDSANSLCADLSQFSGKETFAEFKQKMDRLTDDEVERLMHNLEYTLENYGWKNRVVKAQSGYLKERIEKNMPTEIAQNKDLNVSFDDVKRGVATIDEFISTLSDEELETLCHGDLRMNSPLGAKGNAGVFGGISESLRAKGVPTATATDGPSGIRLTRKASLLPCGTCIASAWNEQLAKELYECVGDEMVEKGSDVLLAPGMNIHRNVLCGRNFEYFSEDPYLTGKTASAIVKGIQSRGVGSCVKHFACNNQEKFRYVNDSRLSERALREIYLKGFEIAIKEGNPLAVMTSYNKINGVYSYHNYDLCTTVLRKEWGYKNLVMTDWWTRKAKNPDFKDVDDNAYRVRAQVDVLMPGGSRVLGKYDGSTLKSLKKGGLKRAELQRTARNVLSFLLKLKKD